MSILALNAAPFDNPNVSLQQTFMTKSQSNETPVNRKKIQQRQRVPSAKVTELMSHLHSQPADYNDMGVEGMESMYMQQHAQQHTQHAQQHGQQQQQHAQHGQQNQPVQQTNVSEYSPNDFDLSTIQNTFMPKKDVESFHQQYSKAPIYNQPSAAPLRYENMPQQPNDALVDKLNHIIGLLEESHDERTNNVTEEVILYSFLGIFIIFIVDSFSRVGAKYVR